MGKKTPRQKIRDKLDEWWGVKVKETQPCEVCGLRPGIHAHHFYKGRTALATRWDIDNGLSLCGGCHMEAHNSPGMFMEKIYERMPNAENKAIGLHRKLQEYTHQTTAELEEMYERLKDGC